MKRDCVVMTVQIPKNATSKLAILAPAAFMLAACGNMAGQGAPKPFAGISSTTTSSQLQTNNVAQGKVGGGIIGSQISLELDDPSRDAALAAEFAALENGRAGEAVKWSNGQSASGTVIPQQTYEVGSQTCRRYSHQVVVNGESREASSTSCRQSSGTWQILS